MSDKLKQNDRRRLIKTSAVAAGAVVVGQSEWAKPVINSVVLPAHAQTSAQTIVQLAQGTADLSTLVGALTQGQIDLLSGAGPFTVFAPTNAAFSAIQSTVDSLTPAQLEAVINYHVVSGIVGFGSIPATTGTTPNQVAQVEASNGRVFVIDQVLLEP